jgi:Flp pilus assembly protein TadD
VASGEREGAVTELRRALDRQPKSVGVHVALGRLLLTIGREVDAVKGYEELLATLEGDDE